MDIDPKKIPVSKTFDISSVSEATSAVDEMVSLGFKDRKDGFRVLMPKQQLLAKQIGYTVTTGITHGLRQKNEIRDVRYWTYHHDKEHYGIVLIDRNVLESLNI